MEAKILLIEEDAILRKNTAEILGLANYEVITAENGKLGIEKAIKSKPDLVLSDIPMNDLDGYGVLQILRKNRELKNTPFIFMSAKTKHSDVRKGMDLGASDYITIPIDKSELLSAIEARLKFGEISNNLNNEDNTAKDHNEIDIESLDQLFAYKEKYDYGKGSTIYCEGNSSNHIFYLIKGEIKTFKNNEYGKELITRIYKRKSIFGLTTLLKNKPYNENASALIDTSLIKITKKEFLDAVKENPRLSINVIDLLVDKLEKLKTHLIHLAYDSVRKKTAEILYELYIDGGSEIIKISRKNLANLVGIAKESLIRTLTELKEEKIIKTKRKSIKIIDPKKLKLIK
jgi:CRP-like cAMP-binding protein